MLGSANCNSRLQVVFLDNFEQKRLLKSAVSLGLGMLFGPYVILQLIYFTVVFFTTQISVPGPLHNVHGPINYIHMKHRSLRKAYKFKQVKQRV
jgi:hypothetical protein